MPTGSLSDWEKQALGILHKDYNTFAPGLTNLIMHESSGNPNAINLTDSNAKAGHPSKGIMQTIDSTFAAYALPGHTDIWNPVDNIIAGFRYAEKNYGDAMIEAGGRKDSKGNYLGYANGAWNLSSDQIAKVHQGEMIIPERIAGAVRSALTQGGISGGGGNTVRIEATFMNTGPQEGSRFLKMVKDAMEGNQVMAQVTGS
jgi:SLT domain-containing protein